MTTPHTSVAALQVCVSQLTLSGVCTSLRPLFAPSTEAHLAARGFLTAILRQPRRHHGMIISSPNRPVQRESYDESDLYLGCHLYVRIGFWPTPSRRPKLPCAQLARTP